MSALNLEPGQTLDHFRILARVGQGGMGVVYRAVDVGLGRVVAIKLLDAPRVATDEARARFHREAAAAAQLKHPNIAAVYEFGEYQGQAFIVLEWIEGETLNALIAREKKLPLDRALKIFSQIADALVYAHARGITHRDVKPSNILLDMSDENHPHDHATLVDFGLVGLAHDSDVTLVGNYFGSPRYMSPEQIRGEASDGRADEYALALVLHEMLTGKPLFDAPTTPALFHQQLHVSPAPISEARPDVPTHIERALTRALEKNPDARFPTVAAFRDALALPPPVRANKTRWRWLGAGAFIGILCAALFGISALSNNIAPASPTATLAATFEATAETPTPALETPSPIEPTAEPTPPLPPDAGGAWTMPGGDAAYKNASNQILPLNPNARWQTETQGAAAGGVAVGGGVVVTGAEGGIARAFDWSNGALVWETNLGAAISGTPAMYLSPERGYVFIPTADSELHALDLANGKLVWRKKQAELLGNVLGNVTVNDDGTLYVTTDSGHVHAIEPTAGTMYWTLDTYKDQGFVQPPTLSNSALFLASSSKIFALASTLEQVWQADVEGKPSAPLTALSNQGIIAIGTDQGRVYAYNILLGRELWKAEVKGAVNGFATDGWFLYATTREGMAYTWVAATGELAWSLELGGTVTAAPLISAGALILVMDDGRVRYFSPYTDFGEQAELNFQIQEAISFTPATASGWLFARGNSVWGFGP